MTVRILAGLAVGAGLGALLGYFGHCSGGACPLTANPWRGAMFGAVIGLLMVLSIRSRRPDARRDAPGIPDEQRRERPTDGSDG